LPWVDLLRDIPGVQITDVDAGCCGMAGTYGFKKEKYQISMDIGKPLFKKMRDSHFDRAASECGMCQTQIGHGAGIKTTHPVQVLARAYGLHSEL
jgi:glycerol-3-phosphate dehydrogenase subunit C